MIRRNQFFNLQMWKKISKRKEEIDFLTCKYERRTQSWRLMKKMLLLIFETTQWQMLLSISEKELNNRDLSEKSVTVIDIYSLYSVKTLVNWQMMSLLSSVSKIYILICIDVCTCALIHMYQVLTVYLWMYQSSHEKLIDFYFSVINHCFLIIKMYLYFL